MFDILKNNESTDSEEPEYQVGLSWTELYTIFILKQTQLAQTSARKQKSVQVCPKAAGVHVSVAATEERKHLARKQV